METILIDVEVSDVEAKLGETVKRIQELKNENKALNKELKNGEGDWGANSAQIARNEAEIKALTATQKTYQGQLTAVNAAERQYGDSIKQQEALLADLRNQYASLSEEQRGSESGSGLLRQIQEVEAATNQARGSMGQYQQNVGHYQLAIQGLNDKFKAVGVTIPGADKAMKLFNATMKANPLGIIATVIGALVAVFAKLKQAFKDNDDAGTALAVAMANFKPILSFINKLFQDLALVVARVAGAIGKAATAIISKLVPGYEAAAKAARDLVVAQDELEEKERERTRSAAANNAKIAELDEKARNSEDYSVKQRREAVRQKQELQEQEYRAELKLAKERLRLRMAEAAQQKKSDDATKNEIASLRAAIDVIERNHNQDLKNNLRIRKQLNNEEKTAARAAAATYKAMRKELADAMKAAGELLADKDSLDYQIKISDQSFTDAVAALKKNYNKLKQAEKAEVDALVAELGKQQEVARAKIIEASVNGEVEAERQKWEAIRQTSADEYDRRLKQAQLAADQQKQIIREQVKNERAAAAAIIEVDQQMADKQVELANLKRGNIKATRESYATESEYQDALLVAENEYLNAVTARMEVQRRASEENIKNVQREIKSRQEMTGAIATAGGAILDLAATVAKNSEENVKLQKAIAVGQVAFSTAISIANAIQGATAAAAATGAAAPFTAPAFIAEMVAIVMSSLASAYSALNSSGYAGGGIVGASMGPDNTYIQARNGEMVINAEQQRRLWEFVNTSQGNNSYNQLYSAVSAAMESMPAPILDYKEFTRFQKTIKYMNNK